MSRHTGFLVTFFQTPLLTPCLAELTWSVFNCLELGTPTDSILELRWTLLNSNSGFDVWTRWASSADCVLCGAYSLPVTPRLSGLAAFAGRLSSWISPPASGPSSEHGTMFSAFCAGWMLFWAGLQLVPNPVTAPDSWLIIASRSLAFVQF